MIGIFDSGFGGLSIFKEIKRALPDNDYIYLGDNARTPYGNRSAETVYQFTKEAVDFLFDKGCQLVVLACFTASSQALRKIQQEYLPEKYPDKNVLGVLIPIVEKAAATSQQKKKRIGVIGTRGTINSKRFSKEISKVDNTIKVYEKATPLLVPLVEEGWIKRRETKMIVRHYLRSLKNEHIDALILGCTHYGLLQKVIAEAAGKSVNTLDSAKIIADSLKDYINRHPEYKLTKGGKVKFYTTDYPERFNELGFRFFGEKVEAEKVRL